MGSMVVCLGGGPCRVQGDDLHVLSLDGRVRSLDAHLEGGGMKLVNPAAVVRSVCDLDSEPNQAKRLRCFE